MLLVVSMYSGILMEDHVSNDKIIGLLEIKVLFLHFGFLCYIPQVLFPLNIPNICSDY